MSTGNPEIGTVGARPWLCSYGRVPSSLRYPETSLYEMLAATARRVPEAIAWDFLGTTSTYGRLLKAIDACADALASLDLRAGDRLLISMPTSPPGLIAFYAANKLGAVPAMIHPLSTPPEIERYVTVSRARIALTLDAFYERFAAIEASPPLEKLILARIPEYLSTPKKIGFWLRQGRKIKVPPDPRVRWWSDLMAAPHPAMPAVVAMAENPAAILFSGGSTGEPKGILLSNRNFIAQGMQTAAWGEMGEGDSILAILPIFHGFGLSVCVNAILMAGGTSILVPTFSPKAVAGLLRRNRPSILVGVPTLFDALSKDSSLAKTDLSCLRAAFSGADTLPQLVKERFESLVAARGGSVKLLEGYGLTEAVTAIMAMPMDQYREGSLGIPFPDTLAKICKPGSDEEPPLGEEGEICISGPAVMLGYLDDPQATHETLRTHADGRTWLHTGDLGRMDGDGFFYFTARLKRVIKSSGFNVYPAQVEGVLCRHPLVAQACVVGVPDASQGERVKAFVVLNDASRASRAVEEELIEFCRGRLIKWSCPREVEFLQELPTTRIGKIDYRLLVQEHIAKPTEKENP